MGACEVITRAAPTIPSVVECDVERGPRLSPFVDEHPVHAGVNAVAVDELLGALGALVDEPERLQEPDGGVVRVEHARVHAVESTVIERVVQPERRGFGPVPAAVCGGG